MELNLVDPAHDTLHGQFGVSDQRMEELVKGLGAIARKNVKQNSPIPKGQVFTEIATFCNSVEELIMCVHAYDGFMFQNFDQCNADGTQNS